jgi:hypothetical protein
MPKLVSGILLQQLRRKRPTTIPISWDLMLTSLVEPVRTPVLMLVLPQALGRMCYQVLTQVALVPVLTQEQERLTNRL